MQTSDLWPEAYYHLKDSKTRINYIVSSLSTVLTGWCLQLKDKLKHIVKAIQTLLKVMEWTTAMAKSITYLQYWKARKTLKQLETTTA